MPRLSLGLGVQTIRKVGGGAAPSSLLSGLLAYWNLDTNSWLDSSGNANTLTYFDSQVSTATGKIGNSASFSGSNYLYKNSFSITTNCSFSFWFKSSASEGVDLGVGVINQESVTYFGGFRILSIDGIIHFQAPSTVFTPGVSSFCDGTFHHAVGTADGSTIRIYIDGIFKQENSDDLGEVSVQDMSIGSYGDGLAQSGTQIDEVGVWNRALSQAEITSLYNAGAGRTYPFN